MSQLFVSVGTPIRIPEYVDVLQVIVVSANFTLMDKYVMELDASDHDQLVLIQNVMALERVSTIKDREFGYEFLRFLTLGDTAEFFSTVALPNCPYELLDPTKFKKCMKCLNVEDIDLRGQRVKYMWTKFLVLPQ
jgi:hypothetical protein